MFKFSEGKNMKTKEQSLENFERQLAEIKSKKEQLLTRENQIIICMEALRDGKSPSQTRKLEVALGMILYRFMRIHRPKIYARILDEADNEKYIVRDDVRDFAGLPPLTQKAANNPITDSEATVPADTGEATVESAPNLVSLAEAQTDPEATVPIQFSSEENPGPEKENKKLNVEETQENWVERFRNEVYSDCT
jgi:hypothetical protein